MSFEEFVAFYRKYGRCPNDIQSRKKPLNEIQLRSRYHKYQESEKKRLDRAVAQFKKAKGGTPENIEEIEVIHDSNWEALKNLVKRRDDDQCRLVKILPYDEYMVLMTKGGSFAKIIDCAHFLGRGSHPALKYCIHNVVLLNRYSHSMLDQNRHPVNGNPIDPERKRQIWLDILGITQYTELQNYMKEKGLGEI